MDQNNNFEELDCGEESLRLGLYEEEWLMESSKKMEKEGQFDLDPVIFL